MHWWVKNPLEAGHVYETAALKLISYVNKVAQPYYCNMRSFIHMVSFWKLLSYQGDRVFVGSSISIRLFEEIWRTLSSA